MAEHEIIMLTNSVNNEIFMRCIDCDEYIDTNEIGVSFDRVVDLVAIHKGEKKVEETVVVIEPVAPKAIERRQNVVDFTNPDGEFLITDRAILDIPFDNFVDFKHVLDQEVAERNLELHIHDVPDGILLTWKFLE